MSFVSVNGNDVVQDNRIKPRVVTFVLKICKLQTTSKCFIQEPPHYERDLASLLTLTRPKGVVRRWTSVETGRGPAAKQPIKRIRPLHFQPPAPVFLERTIPRPRTRALREGDDIDSYVSEERTPPDRLERYGYPIEIRGQ